MAQKYILGIDIGGTNTDAVLIDHEKKIVAWHKTTTTQDIAQGFSTAIHYLLQSTSINPQEIASVLVGTTHATNAILQKNNVLKVGVLRIAGQKPDVLPPAFSWPQDIRDAMYSGSVTVNGGFNCDGKTITPFNEKEIEVAAQELLAQGAQSIAIVGVFSAINREQEMRAHSIIQKVAGENFPITMSCEIGSVGFVERENATILNCALKNCIKIGFMSLEDALRSLGVHAPLFMTQNNGTIISFESALNFPILTISAGPTNSFVGGAKLAGLENAIVVDIGGTSTDVGIVLNGFARRSVGSSFLAGISLNFAMPDVISISLGGGSYITQNKNSDWMIGPESAAKKTLLESKSFGGQMLTLTDVALAAGQCKIPDADPSKVTLDSQHIDQIYKSIQETIVTLSKRIAGALKLPIVLVGGGAQLLPKDLIPHSFRPEFSSVANAYGAALAEISGIVDTVVSLNARDETLAQLQNEAIERAVLRGAHKSLIRIVDKQIIPFHYVPNNLARVIIVAAGPSNAMNVLS